MTQPDLVVVDVLDAAGAAVADAVLRRRALLEAGASVRSLVLVPSDEAAPRMPGVEPFTSASALERHLHGIIAHAPRAQVVLACAGPSAFRIIARVPARRCAGWWPLAVHAAPPTWWPFRGAALRPWPALRALHCASANAGAMAPAALALATSLCEAPGQARVRLPLWDGDYLLALTTLAPAEGAALLRGFARVAADRSGLDLVVLGPPQPRLSAAAAALGIGMRVHFAGPAAHDAELAWCASAEAVVIAPAGALAACSVLRVLACGAPVMVPRAGAAPDALQSWLSEAGAAGAAQCAPVSSASLQQVLDRGGTVERARAAGRALAARHTADALAGALRPAIDAWRQPPPAAARAA